MLGKRVGKSDGSWLFEGSLDKIFEGDTVGVCVGTDEAFIEGTTEGAAVGFTVG